MRFIKYSLFLISSFLCGILGYATLALDMAIIQDLPLPAIDGSGQYIYYPPSTANFLVIVSSISTAIPIFIVSFMPSKKTKTTSRGCLEKVLVNGFKFFFLSGVAYMAGIFVGVNGFLAVLYGFGQIYGIPMPPLRLFNSFPSEGIINLMLFGTVMMISPFLIVVGVLIVLKIVEMAGNGLVAFFSTPSGVPGNHSSLGSGRGESFPYNPYVSELKDLERERRWEQMDKEKEIKEQEEEDQRNRAWEQRAEEEMEQERQNQQAREEADREWQRKHDEEEEYNRKMRGY
jgi:hypothetical protein